MTLNKTCRKILGTAMLIFVMLAGAPASFADQEPPLPAPLQNMANEGAQMRYLGQQNGLDGWIAIKNGKEQYFYVTSDGQAFVMGLMFDKTGKLVTVRQVQQLQKSSDGKTLDLFANGSIDSAVAAADKKEETHKTDREFKTPAEQLYSDVEGSNWIALGKSDAPYIYMFVDPQCPYCRAFMNDLRHDYIDNGLLQVRIVPVGFRAETKAQAAFLLAVPNPQKRWYAHLDGDDTALPVTPDINEQGVERNMAIMQSWKISATPFTIYRAASGEVKIVQGRAQNASQIISDLKK